MIRNVGFEEISDGTIYRANDMVKAGCGDCNGCHACCEGMGNSLILDPFDVFNLSAGAGSSFVEMMQNGTVELAMHDGVILPNIKMDPACKFLDDYGRCTVHKYRPGICRLFPLGRIYEEEGFGYFLQVNECLKKNRTKVKVKQWIGIDNLPAYEEFVLDWHNIVKNITDWASECRAKEINEEDGMRLNLVCTKLLNIFFVTEYDTKADFYDQFKQRCQEFEKACI